jgi:hypothetical protein
MGHADKKGFGDGGLAHIINQCHNVVDICVSKPQCTQ